MFLDKSQACGMVRPSGLQPLCPLVAGEIDRRMAGMGKGVAKGGGKMGGGSRAGW